MKTKEELNALKKEIEALNKKLTELTEEELKKVVGGIDMGNNLGGSIQEVIGDWNLNRSSVGVNPSSKTLETRFEVVTGKNGKSVNVNEVLT